MKKLMLFLGMALMMAVTAPAVYAQDNAPADTTVVAAPAKKAKKKIRPIEEIVAEMAAKCPDKEADGSVTETVMIVEDQVFMKQRAPITGEQITQMNAFVSEIKPVMLSQMLNSNDPEAREFFKALRKAGKGLTLILGPLEGDETLTIMYTPAEIKAAR